MKIALIGCTAKKRDECCKAIDMYSPSPLFKGRIKYCKEENITHMYILSAKYGLLEPNDIIEPYNCNLNKTNREYRQEWNKKVLNKLKDKTNIDIDEFILLAGSEYTKNLKKYLKNTENPVEGLGIGKQLHFFNNYSSEDNFVAAIKLRNKNELSKIPDKIGYYKWWAKKEDFNYICERLYVNYDDIKDDVEVKNNYYGLYVGIAANESVRARINWHVNDIHSKSRVENGTLSTFRQSISSIVVENQYDKDSTNEFIDKLNVEYFTLEYPIKSVEAKEELHNIERNLLINNLYLLNIQENKHPKSKPIKKRLKYLRKISKEI